jgi:hypothetical protein
VSFSHGSTGVLRVTTGGTLREFTSYVNTTGIAREIDKAETSTLGSTAKSYIMGLADGSIPVDGLFDPTIDGYFATLGSAVPGTGGTAFEFYPAGTATTNVKYAGSVILTKYEIKTDVGDANQISGEFQITGPVTRTVI